MISMNRTLSFLFAAALGATLGALIAIEFAPPLGFSEGLAATFGVIIGGLVGYIAVDFQQFLTSVLRAYQVAFALPSATISKIKIVRKHYRATSSDQKKNGLYFAGGLFFVYAYIFYFAIFPLLAYNPLVSGAFVTFMIAIVLMAGFTVTLYPSTRAISGKSLLYWSTIGIPHSLIFKVLPWLAVGLYKIGSWLVVQTGVFLKTLFVATHSDRRVLCCLDAMLGTLVGYYAGSWPLGTVSGLLFAVVSYELVSKRWLKLAPA